MSASESSDFMALYKSVFNIYRAVTWGGQGGAYALGRHVVGAALSWDVKIFGTDSWMKPRISTTVYDVPVFRCASYSSAMCEAKHCSVHCSVLFLQ